MSAVKLDVLNWVSEAQLIDACASRHVAMHFNNRESID